MIKVGVFAVCGVLLALVLRKEKPELSLLLGVCVGMVLLAVVLYQISDVFSFCEEQLAKLSLDKSNLIAMIKILGISYVAEFSASICRDFGYSSIASVVELVAKVSILVLSLNAFVSILEVIGGIL